VFAAWAHIVYRHPLRVLGVSAVFLVGFVVALARGGTLTSGLIEGIEAERGLALVEQATGRPA
jgi:hypothetical protein